MNIKTGYLYFLTLFAFVGCTADDPDYIEGPLPLLEVPSNFPLPSEHPENPLTASGVALGEKLFFDVRLSGNNSVSCATCHQPEMAFSDGVALSSSGISGNTLLRHAPALINLAWMDNGLFWDGGSTNLESQAFAPLAHPDEMFQDLEELVTELEGDQLYSQLFEQAFSSEVQANLVMKALAQYQRTLVSANSKYDQFIRGENQVELTEKEWQGYLLFQDKCTSCHKTDLFTDNDYHNNGLDASFDDLSHEEIFLGRYRITRDPQDIGKFKTPTLRNIAVTGPYMHDGRFNTLKEVLDFYDNDVQDSETLDIVLKQDVGIGLTEDEKQNLIAFLNTLTDNTFIENENF